MLLIIVEFLIKMGGEDLWSALVKNRAAIKQAKEDANAPLSDSEEANDLLR